MINKKFTLKAKDGRIVNVEFKSHYFGERHPCPHLEFRGNAISETGYYSHFFGSPYAEEPQPTFEDAKLLAEKLLEEKYLPPQVLQNSLF